MESERVCEKFGDFETISCGGYLGTLLVQAGLKTFFTVPGDYNLTLLDELIKLKSLRMVGCCNELNAGYNLHLKFTMNNLYIF